MKEDPICNKLEWSFKAFFILYIYTTNLDMDWLRRCYDYTLLYTGKEAQ